MPSDHMQRRAFAKLIRGHGDQGIALCTPAEPEQERVLRDGQGDPGEAERDALLLPPLLLCRGGGAPSGEPGDGHEARAT